MASLAALIYKTLTQNSELTEKLSQFKNKPAVFENFAPHEKNRRWSTTEKHPRIEYTVAFNSDTQRKIAGTLQVHATTTMESEDGAEIFDEIIKTLLDGIFVEATDHGTVAVKWSRSDGYTTQDELFTGVTVTFELLAFPKQISVSDTETEADPIFSLVQLTKSIIGEENAFYIDGGEQEETWMPTSDKPAIYWRTTSNNVFQITSGVVWFNQECVCHVITQNPSDRLIYIRKITEGLAIAGEVTMVDEIPFIFIGSIRADSNADPITAGQINITGRYGVLRPREEGELIMNIGLR